jgi:nicotinate-nucleotide adenylyltransferase
MKIRSTVHGPRLKKKIGILGGTFNPIHYGHLRMASETAFVLNLDKVLFIPSANPPHKKKEYILSSGNRYEMTKLAIRGNQKFQISDLELKRKGTSYTIDTIIELKNIYKKAILYFIIGSDSLAEIPTWKDCRGLVGLCRFVVVERPGYDLVPIKKKFRNLFGGKNPIFVGTQGLDISSTDIRNRVKERRPIKYLVPENIESYIKRKGLYNEKR